MKVARLLNLILKRTKKNTAKLDFVLCAMNLGMKKKRQTTTMKVGDLVGAQEHDGGNLVQIYVVGMNMKVDDQPTVV